MSKNLTSWNCSIYFFLQFVRHEEYFQYIHLATEYPVYTNPVQLGTQSILPNQQTWADILTLQTNHKGGIYEERDKNKNELNCTKKNSKTKPQFQQPPPLPLSFEFCRSTTCAHFPKASCNCATVMIPCCNQLASN